MFKINASYLGVMKNINGLEQWAKDKNIPDSRRFVEVTIYVKYPDQEQFRQFEPKERLKKIDEYHRECIRQLIALNLFENYETIGTKKRPRGVKTRVKYTLLNKFSKLNLNYSTHVEAVGDAIKLEDAPQSEQRYYAVKMTVVIEIEGVLSKKQSIEERIVVVKASSYQDAYDRLDKNKDDYAQPYLNSDGRFVRWRIESFDDCCDTDAVTIEDFDKPEGVEVYSKLKSRKSKQQVAWDGKS